MFVMKEKSFIKVCIFLKFRRHFETSRADADFQRFRFHDVSECFITAGNYKHMRTERIRKYLQWVDKKKVAPSNYNTGIGIYDV